MNGRMTFKARWLLVAACLAASASLRLACAADVYKWTDANGRVHFGDRFSAPADGQKTDIKSSPAPAPVPVQPRATPTAPAPAARGPVPVAPGKSQPADAWEVRPGCKELIDRVAAVPAGTNWEALSRQFDATCPGIAYECTRFRSRPENDKCEWVKRTSGNIMQTNSYP